MSSRDIPPITYDDIARLYQVLSDTSHGYSFRATFDETAGSITVTRSIYTATFSINIECDKELIVTDNTTFTPKSVTLSASQRKSYLSMLPAETRYIERAFIFLISLKDATPSLANSLFAFADGYRVRLDQQIVSK